MIFQILRLRAMVFGLMLLSAISVSLSAGELRLHPGGGGAHEVDLTEVSPGEVVLTTNGSDPYFFVEFTDGVYSTGGDGRQILSFEYFSLSGTKFLQVFLTPGVSESESSLFPGIEPSQGWTTYWADVTDLVAKRLSNGKGKISGFRLDPGNRSGIDLRIRNMQLRPPTESENRILEQADYIKSQERNASEKLRRYVYESHFPGHIDKVGVTSEEIHLSGRISDGNEVGDVVRIGGFPVSRGPDNPGVPTFSVGLEKTTITSEKFDIRIPVSRLNGDTVMVEPELLKWALYVHSETGDGTQMVRLLSAFHYPDEVESLYNYPEEKPFNRKGLGAWGPGRPESDLEDLGVSAVTVNILVNSLLRSSPGPDCQPHTFGGREWYVHVPTLHRYDNIVRSATERNLIVSAIILVPQGGSFSDKSVGRLVAHPDAQPAGIYVMPNLEADDGVWAYAAILDVLASRYSRPDKRYGRIHYWIIHNEVNSGWVWTNAGEKSSLRYMDLYTRSMRLTHLISRRYNPHARVFISLDHHWTTRHGDMGYTGREVVEHLHALCIKEGDFEWAVAHHPYPESLFKPDVWTDSEAVDSFDTPKITFKNLEVLEKWFSQPAYRFRGEPRLIHLSEQGLNSPDYSEESLQLQARGMQYAWERMEPLKSIEMFHYHNWVDNRHEGGLRIGLRKFPDDPDDPLGKKPIWYIFRDLGRN